MVIRTVLGELSTPEATVLNRHSGEPDIATNTSHDLFPLEAFQEALALTAGSPAHGAAEDDLATVSSADYVAVVKAHFEAITGNRALTQAEVNRVVAMLDAVGQHVA